MMAANGDVLPRAAAAEEDRGMPPTEEVAPTDAEVERGILNALSRGLDGVAKTLATLLDDRRREKTADVISLYEERARRGWYARYRTLCRRRR